MTGEPLGILDYPSNALYLTITKKTLNTFYKNKDDKMKIKFYEYNNCGTCKKALKYLESKNIEIEKIPIRENPPSINELITMLSKLNDSKKLFNTSGNDYKEMKLKTKILQLNDEQRIKLLASNGNLIKRPFVLGENFGLVGFKEDEWNKIFK